MSIFGEQERRLERLRQARERRSLDRLERRRRWARTAFQHHANRSQEFARQGRHADAEWAYEAALEFLLEWRSVDPLAGLVVLRSPSTVMGNEASHHTEGET